MNYETDKKETVISLYLKEHFIISNLIKILPKYVLLWTLAIGVGIGCSYIPCAQPVNDYAGMRAFAIAFITIATTTITFAIPTCMRTIFSAYDEYYSTKIKQILLQRFPVTLLALSAFTSLILSILIVSGIIGIAVNVPHNIVFYISLFWTLVCVVYLFNAIEKMVYFTVNAPYAVIDKLEYAIMSHKHITNKNDYRDFRNELRAINDIASTIISRATGQDKSVVTALKSMYNIHKYYLNSATTLIEAGTKDNKQLKFHLDACRSVDHEMVRLFRAATRSQNEHACRTILKTYCAMMSDAFKTETGVGYFTDMIEELPKIQSYARTCRIEEIENIAYVEWFYILAKTLIVQNYDRAKFALIVRVLAETLRRAVLDGNDNIIYLFMRMASNTNPSHEVQKIGNIWLNMLDRTIFVFVTWLLDVMPEGVEKYIDYIRRYSMFDKEAYRSVLPDSKERIEELIAYESLASINNEKISKNTDRFIMSSDHMALAMSITLEDTASHTLTMLALMKHANIHIEEVASFGRAGEKLAASVEALQNREDSEMFEKRLEYARMLIPGILEEYDNNENDENKDTKIILL